MDYNVNVTYAEDECESEEEYLQRVSDYLNSTVEPSSCWVDPLSELDQACAGAAEEGGLVLSDLPESGSSLDELRSAFVHFDEDHDGKLSRAEFKAIICGIDAGSVGLSDAEFEDIFEHVDADHSGDIDTEEFIQWALAELPAEAQHAAAVAHPKSFHKKAERLTMTGATREEEKAGGRVAPHRHRGRTVQPGEKSLMKVVEPLAGEEGLPEIEPNSDLFQVRVKQLAPGRPVWPYVVHKATTVKELKEKIINDGHSMTVTPGGAGGLGAGADGATTSTGIIHGTSHAAAPAFPPYLFFGLMWRGPSAGRGPSTGGGAQWRFLLDDCTMESVGVEDETELYFVFQRKPLRMYDSWGPLRQQQHTRGL